MNKTLVILVGAILVAAAGYWFYRVACDSEPSCACRSASPGDPTCMSPEALESWCSTQQNRAELPQCHL